MKLAGTSDTGWVPIDLRDVAAAIVTLRGSAVLLRERVEPRRPKRSDRRT